MWRPQRSELGAKIDRATQSSCIKRLSRDLKDIRDNVVPVVGVAALPLERNIKVWHCNLRGPKNTPYEGGLWHVILEFPDSYPYDPPSVTICTTLPHPNVINNSICLDMLEPGDEQERYIGWSSAYSVQSILIQLQAFLFEDEPSYGKDRDGGRERSKERSRDRDDRSGRRSDRRQISDNIREAIESANDFHCTSCPHRPLRSWPEIPIYSQKDDTFLLLKPEKEIIKEELICFHSKRGFDDDVLGVGITFNRNIKTGEVQNISSPLDLIGIKAFMREGIRKSAFNEPFTHWLPIYIETQHGEKAFHLCKKSVSMICANSTKQFDPSMASVFPKLMSTMVVNIMKGATYHSIRALEGYCMFHRMWIQFLKEYPELLESYKKSIKEFIESEEGRNKTKIPNLGEFLPLLSVVLDVNWNDIVDILISESLSRQVLHLIAEYPRLETTEPDASVDKERENVTFGATLVSTRLIMFHYFFLENIKKLGNNINEISSSYDDFYGRPNNQMVENIQKGFKEIISVKNYVDYFSRIGKKKIPGTSAEVNEMLRQAVKDSKLKGYHGQVGPKIPTAEELAEESAAKVVSLDTLCIKDEDEEGKGKEKVENENEKEKSKKKVLHSNETEWQKLCENRWGFLTLPNEEKNSWKHLYLRNNMQDIISKLPDRPDFPLLYSTIQLSSECITELSLVLTSPKKLKSGFYWLSQVISGLDNLKRLTIHKGPDADLGLKGIRNLSKGLLKKKQSGHSSLEYLNLSRAGVTGTDLFKGKLSDGLLAADNLHTLILEGNNIRFDGIKHCLGLVLWDHKNLENLNLINCDLDVSAAKELADALLANKKLKIIKLSRNPMQIQGLKSIIYNLAFSPSLEILELCNIIQTGTGPEIIELSEAITKLFRISVTLKQLNLWKTNISGALTQDTIESIGSNRSINHIDLGEVGALNANQLGFLGKALSSNKSIDNLILEKCKIDGAGMDRFYTSLFLEKEAKDKANDGKNLSKEAREKEMALVRRNEIRATLGENSNSGIPKSAISSKEFSLNLTKLNLYGNSLFHGGQVLGKVLMIAKSLIHLNLESCGLGVAAGETLGIALETNNILKELNLKKNGLGREGVKLLCVGLKENTSLEFLDLSGNHMGVSGARAMSSVLSGENCGIKNLNLFGNFIDVEGANEIAKSLAENNGNLQNIDLGLNRIRDKGAIAISNSLKNNSKLILQKIGLKLNFIKDLGVKEFVNSVSFVNKRNKEKNLDLIQKITLAGNSFTDEALISIAKVLNEVNCDFDLSSRIALLDPEKVERSVWVTPLSGTVTKDAVRKMFYDNYCGIVNSVAVHSHKVKTSASKAQYAFVEFAHKNSVDLALDLTNPQKNNSNNNANNNNNNNNTTDKIVSRGAYVDGAKVKIYRVGTGTKGQTDVHEPAGRGRGAPRDGRVQRGGRGGGAPRGGGRGGQRDRPRDARVDQRSDRKTGW